MASFNNDPVALFLAQFPVGFLLELPLLLRALYLKADETTGSLVADDHRHDLYPYIRRSLVEHGIVAAASKYSGLHAIIKRNRSGNTRVELSTQNFIMPICYTKNSCKLVRHAVYRRLDSMRNYPLLAEPLDEILPEMKFAAVLLHGHDSAKKFDSSFAVVRFPSPGFTSYLDERIDLVRLAADALVSLPSTDEMEVIPDSLVPRLRQDLEDRKHV